MTKKLMLLFFAALLLSAAALAAGSDNFFGVDLFGKDNVFGPVWEPIKSIFGGISSLDPDQQKTIVYALLFIVLFTTVYSGLKLATGSMNGMGFFQGAPSLALSFAVAVAGVVFIPKDALLKIGGTYGGLAFFLMFAPFLIFGISGALKSNGWIRVVIVGLLLWSFVYLNAGSQGASSSRSGLVLGINQVVVSGLTLWLLFSVAQAFGFGGGSSAGGFNLPRFGGGRNADRNDPSQRAADEEIAESNLQLNLSPEIQQKTVEMENTGRELVANFDNIKRTLQDMVTNAQSIYSPEGVLDAAKARRNGELLGELRAEVQKFNPEFKRLNDSARTLTQDLEQIANNARQTFNDIKRQMYSRFDGTVSGLQNDLYEVTNAHEKFKKIIQEMSRWEQYMMQLFMPGQRSASFRLHLKFLVSRRPDERAQGIEGIKSIIKAITTIEQVVKTTNSHVASFHSSFAKFTAQAQKIRQSAQAQKASAQMPLFND